MLDTDVSFVLTQVIVPNPELKNYHPTLPASKKLRLQISPESCVKEMTSILLARVPVAPFTFHALVAKTRQGYELGSDDPVGEVAERGDAMRSCANLLRPKTHNISHSKHTHTLFCLQMWRFFSHTLPSPFQSLRGAVRLRSALLPLETSQGIAPSRRKACIAENQKLAALFLARPCAAR